LDRKNNLRLSGKIKDKDLLEMQIIKGDKKPEYYEHLSRSLGFLEIKDMTRIAIQYNNPTAVLSLLKTNLYAATSALSTSSGAQFLSQQEKSTQGNALIQMYFMVRTVAPLKYKKLMRRIARNVILKSSLKIAGRGLEKGMERRRVPYQPGMEEFDLETTMYNILEKGNQQLTSLSYYDIVGQLRTQVKKNVVLILDVSGSMYGRSLLNAALTTSVLSYVMDKHHYAVVLFNSTAMVLKRIREEKPVITIIDQILDSEAVGFTNIETGLQHGLKELNKITGKHKFGILVTDGNYNRGANPMIIAEKYPTLHVVAMPPNKNEIEGLHICRDIAKSGRGQYYQVSNYHEIPRAIMKILHI
jgi:Mg-chelatase subunit ChlD